MSYLLEDWERVDEVNLLSILVHINPFKIFISTLLIPYTFLFCHEHLFPKFAMSFPIEPRIRCRLRLIHIQSADVMLRVYRTVWERNTYSHRHRHNPSRAHRKRDIKKIIVGSFFYCTCGLRLIMRVSQPCSFVQSAHNCYFQHLSITILTAITTLNSHRRVCIVFLVYKRVLMIVRSFVTINTIMSHLTIVHHILLSLNDSKMWHHSIDSYYRYCHWP